MSEDIVEVVEEVQPGRVFSVEKGGIWFSGMNANLGFLVRRVMDALQEAGYEVRPPREDGAAEFGGIYLPVRSAREVDNETHKALVSPPGGSRVEAARDP